MGESRDEQGSSDPMAYDAAVGLPEVEYRSHTNTSRKVIFGGVCCALLAVSAALRAEEGKGAWPIVLALGITLVAVGACYWVFQSLVRTRVGFYENGVLVETVWSETFTRWDDIEAIFEFDPPNDINSFGVEVKKYQCGFSQTEGRTFWFHINRMSHLRDLAARLHRHVDELIRARTRRELAAGAVVWFGHIGIGRDGVHSRKGVLPWAEVAFAGCVHETHFEVLKKGSKWGWFSRKVSEVENVAILTEFMRTWKDWVLPG